MSKLIPEITTDLAQWFTKQHVFFVASAPLSPDGHVNCSPKGGDSFRVLGPLEVAYQDYTGSGAETVAHLRENGRIVLMFCDFVAAPQIVRLHGEGRVVAPEQLEFKELDALFPPNPGTRAIIHIQVKRVSTSCGFSVPFFEFKEDRDMLDNWASKQGEERLDAYRKTKNNRSIDGIPALGSEN